jgi:hypothetical protein
VNFTILSAELPQFNVVAVNERLGLLDCRFVVFEFSSTALRKLTSESTI